MLFRSIEDAVRFYETAEARNGAIEARLDEFLGAPDEKASALVFGGFHANEIKTMLRRKGFSYVVFTPKMGGISSKHRDYYRQLMRTGRLPFETPFQVSKAARVLSLFERRELIGHAALMDEMRTLASIVESAPSADIELLDRRVGRMLIGGDRVESSADTIRSESRDEAAAGTEERDALNARLRKGEPQAREEVKRMMTALSVRMGTDRLSVSEFRNRIGAFAREEEIDLSFVPKNPIAYAGFLIRRIRESWQREDWGECLAELLALVFQIGLDYRAILKRDAAGKIRSMEVVTGPFVIPYIDLVIGLSLLSIFGPLPLMVAICLGGYLAFHVLIGVWTWLSNAELQELAGVYGVLFVRRLYTKGFIDEETLSSAEKNAEPLGSMFRFQRRVRAGSDRNARRSQGPRGATR